MDERCPRCDRPTPATARFCGACGLSLADGHRGAAVPGRVRHPEPASVPDGFEPVADAADLHFRSESAWGGRRLLGTENIGVVLLNAGYALQEVCVRIRGFDENDRELFSVESDGVDLPRGEPVTVEVASYEIPAGPRRLGVALVSAEFAPAE